MRVIATAFALAVLAGAAWAVWAVRSRHDCFNHVEQVIRGAAGYDVQTVEEVCDVDTELIYLVPRDSEQRRLIFSYVRMGVSPMFRREDVAPTIRWLDRTHLLIEIDLVEQILERQDMVQGIHVQYRIGRVLYPGH
jgi:hypothetical protein